MKLLLDGRCTVMKSLRKGNNSSELNITEGALYPALHWKQKEF
jgi:hypothetical protein